MCKQDVPTCVHVTLYICFYKEIACEMKYVDQQYTDLIGIFFVSVGSNKHYPHQ